MNGVIYARYSCEKQTENSILGQVRECKLFAEKNGITVTDIYKDEAISGRTAEKRPSFMKMINDAKMHFFDCVIVWKGDRFSRSRADAAKYKSELKKYGVRVLSATEANVTGPEAVLMDGINEAFAEYFSVELAAKVDRGMTQNCIDGKFNGGVLPLGYGLDGTKVILIPKEAKIVEEMFDLYVNENMTQKEICALFAKKGYFDKKGKPITKSALNRMFHCEKYYGHYQFKGTVNDNIYPQIVSKEIFDQAQAKGRVNKERSQTYKARASYLLSGKLICGECKRSMTGTVANGHGGKFHYYQCPDGRKSWHKPLKYIRKEVLEDCVVDATIDFIKNQTKFETMMKSISEAISSTVPDLQIYENAVIKLQKKIETLIDIADENCDSKILAKKINDLEQQKIAAEKELNERKRIANIFSEEHVREFFKQLRIRDYLSFNDKKYLVETLVSKVYYFTDENIKIYFNYNGSGASGGNSSGFGYETDRVTNVG